MTDLNETIKVMQHFRDGGEVEARHISGMTWGICRDPDWNFALFEYRIKPGKKERDLLKDENAKLRAENDRLRWTFEFLDKLEQFLEHKGLVGEYKEWKKEQSNYE